MPTLLRRLSASWRHLRWRAARTLIDPLQRRAIKLLFACHEALDRRNSVRVERTIGPEQKAVVLMVYRHRNARVAKRLLGSTPPRSWDIRLWALDEPHPDLAHWTLGVGRGGRFHLINGLLDQRPVPAEAMVVVADDDVFFSSGSLSKLIAVGDRAGFGIFAPGHSLLSFHGYRLTLGRPWSLARLTLFVEIGPVVVVAPAWQARVLPFAVSSPMGWGTEVDWTLLRAEGCRLGIVDAARVVHCSPVAAGYEDQMEIEALERALQRTRARAITDFHHFQRYWFRWQRRAPWLDQSNAGASDEEYARLLLC